MGRENNDTQTGKWDKIIKPHSGWFDIHPRELWTYRDLVGLFVWRDFVAVYKQTILGPLWYIIQPLLTSIVFMIIFGNVAKIPTDGNPPFLFYLSGVVAWRYFADCLTNTSNTFVSNAHLFGKVYFPRLAVPVSVVISNLISFGIQLLLFIGVFIFYRFTGSIIVSQPALALVPILIMQMAALGLGLGMIVSSLTCRYRDLTHLVSFGTQLWMFATPVVYPVSALPEKWRLLLLLNPLAPVIEAFRFAFLGTGFFDFAFWVISLLSTTSILFVGIVLFNKVEKSFMDTV